MSPRVFGRSSPDTPRCVTAGTVPSDLPRPARALRRPVQFSFAAWHRAPPPPRTTVTTMFEAARRRCVDYGRSASGKGVGSGVQNGGGPDHGTPDGSRRHPRPPSLGCCPLRLGAGSGSPASDGIFGQRLRVGNLSEARSRLRSEPKAQGRGRQRRFRVPRAEEAGPHHTQPHLTRDTLRPPPPIRCRQSILGSPSPPRREAAGPARRPAHGQPASIQCTTTPTFTASDETPRTYYPRPTDGGTSVRRRHLLLLAGGTQCLDG
jgi:hypothetical protein